MTVDEKKVKFTTNREGKTIYFCSAASKASFDKNPQKYIHPQNSQRPKLISEGHDIGNPISDG
jgi:YHS domain-containing protein